MNINEFFHYDPSVSPTLFNFPWFLLNRIYEAHFHCFIWMLKKEGKENKTTESNPCNQRRSLKTWIQWMKQSPLVYDLFDSDSFICTCGSRTSEHHEIVCVDGPLQKRTDRKLCIIGSSVSSSEQNIAKRPEALKASKKKPCWGALQLLPPEMTASAANLKQLSLKASALLSESICKCRVCQTPSQSKRKYQMGDPLRRCNTMPVLAGEARSGEGQLWEWGGSAGE